MLVSELTTELLREWSESNDDPSKVSLMESWIRSALDDFALYTNFKILKARTQITTAASDFFYELPTACRTVIGMRIEALDRPIEQKSGQELILSNANLDELGTPRIWFYHSGVEDETETTKMSNRIRFYPVPDDDYVIDVHYISHPGADLVASDVLPVEVQHINTIKNRVRFYMAMDDKDYASANIWDAKFMGNIQALVSSENARPAQRRTMQQTDLRSRKEEFVRLDPYHFSRG